MSGDQQHDARVVNVDRPQVWTSASGPRDGQPGRGRVGREPAPTRRVRRTTRGRRTRLRRHQRRRSVLHTMGFVLMTLGVTVVLVLAFERLVRTGSEDITDGGTLTAEPQQDVQPTFVLATFDEADPTAGANLIVIAAHDRLAGTRTLVFVPATTVADVPGHGLLPVGDAFAFGEGPLLDATLDNLLGLDLDHVVALSEQGWSSLFTRLGGLSVELPERLVVTGEDGSSEVRFRPGEQFLDGPRLAELLTFTQDGETQLAQLPRAQLVLTAMLDAIAEDPSLLDEVFADGAPMLDTPAPTADVRAILEQLVAAHAEGELVVRTLPVNPIGSGEDDTYRLDVERATRLIEDRFAGSVPVGSEDEGRLLQILNGQGEPGIGGQVAQLLLPRGFRVVLTGNADDFDYDETRIVVYEDSPDQIAIAEEIKRVLGVGRIEFSRAPQSVVDITIVVGRDFTGGG